MLTLRLPRPRPDQVGALTDPARFQLLICGRRWGKNTICLCSVCLGRGSALLGRVWRGLLDGGRIGWCSRTEKMAEDTWRSLRSMLAPLTVEKREDTRRLRLSTGGQLLLYSAHDPDSIRGPGFDGLIADEFAFYDEDWWRIARPTLSDRQGWAVFATTPPDLPGWFSDMYEAALERVRAGGADWSVIQRPSSDNPLLTSADLADALEDLGEVVFLREYGAEMMFRTGGFFRPETLERRFEGAMALPLVVLAVDSAFKTGVRNDYSVIAVWGTDFRDYFLLDLWRDRVEFPELKRAIVSKALQWDPAEVLIEDKASGISVIQELQRESGWPVVAVGASDSPIARVEAVTPLFDARKVALPSGAPWLADWVREHLRYPGGGHDDQVMTTAIGLRRLKRGLRVARGRAA